MSPVILGICCQLGTFPTLSFRVAPLHFLVVASAGRDAGDSSCTVCYVAVEAKELASCHEQNSNEFASPHSRVMLAVVPLMPVIHCYSLHGACALYTMLVTGSGKTQHTKKVLLIERRRHQREALPHHPKALTGISCFRTDGLQSTGMTSCAGQMFVTGPNSDSQRLHQLRKFP